MKIGRVIVFMRAWCCIALYLFAITASATEMIVTKKGESFRITDRKRNTDKLLCKSEKDGAIHTILITDIDTIIPIVTPGTKYTLAEIEETLAKIDKVSRKYVSMTRKINIIQTEWMSLKKNMTSTADSEIKGIVSTFSRYNSDSAYSKAMMDLGMLQYKRKGDDASIAAIEAATGEIKTMFLGFNLKEFIGQARNDKISLSEFLTLKAKANKALKKKCLSEDKTAINNALSFGRGTLLDKYTPYAEKSFRSRRSVDTYLNGYSLLSTLKDDVAYSPDEKSLLDKKISEFMTIVKEKLKTTDFSHNDFPLNKKDLSALETTEPFCSTTDYKHIKVSREWSYIIPAKVPVIKGGIQGRVAAPFTVVLKRKPLIKSEYGLMIVSDMYKKVNKHYIPLPKLQFRSAHATIPFRYSLSKIGTDNKPLTDSDGKYFLIYMVQRPVNKDVVGSDEKWIPVSKACRIPIPEPPPEEEVTQNSKPPAQENKLKNNGLRSFNKGKGTKRTMGS